MYTGSAARIYNPRPDPAERGPPKRVTRDESHIGEMVAASKKRISWRFTLGESDMTHEVVLVHSIMSYKKVIEFDGRQMHYSATFTPGDWKFLMVLEGSNHVFEVRINDLESADVPKYDLAVDRIPYRHWDVYRRRKQPVTTATYAQPYASQQQQPTSTFGTQRWGPSGMSAPPPPPEPTGGRYGGYPNGGAGAGAYNREGRSSSFGAQRDSGGNRGSFTGSQRDSGGSRGSFTGSPPYQQVQQQQQQRRSSGQLSAPPPVPHNAQSPPAPTPATATKKQPEINLIDDFGPSVSVPAQTLLFDPLAGSNFAAPTASSTPQAQPQPLNNTRTSSNPAFAPPFSAQPRPTATPYVTYVDPFANVPQAAPLQPAAAPMNFSQFVAPSNAYPQQQQQQRVPQTGGMYAPGAFQQQPMATGGTPVMPMTMQPPQQQQQPMTMQPPQQQQPMAVALGANRMPGVAQQQLAPAMPVQPVRVGGTLGVNYNISQLMNPVDVNGAPQRQPAKTINIDAFAGMG